MEPNTITYNAAISACGKGGEWQRAMATYCDALRGHLITDSVSCNSILDALHGRSHAKVFFDRAMEVGTYSFVTALGVDRLNLHDCSPGSAALLVRWWILKVLPVQQWTGMRPSRFQIVTGWGKHRKEWSTACLQRTVCEELDMLRLRWRLVNAGCLEVDFEELGGG